MESGKVDALFIPMETEAGMVSPALIHDPRLLEKANPLAPVLAINGARAVSALTGKGAPVRLGAVLRSCELRALVELVKLQQASRRRDPDQHRLPGTAEEPPMPERRRTAEWI
jgi:formate dehydrogenase subunit beta